jgi:sterol desaturase/sphingolipid hydroxylase (fatty acid hydroxylase superfamily)
VGHFVGFCARYFALAGCLYWVSHVALRQRWLVYRIQRPFPSGADIRHEVRWSLASAGCTGLSTMLIYGLIGAGRSSVYSDVAEHGWAYLVLSIGLCLVGYDTWIYWQHRVLHTRWLFRHVHALHHRVANPTAFGAFSQHPVETLMGNVYFILIVVVVPIHPLAIACTGAAMFGVALIAHCGYELFPRGFTRHPVFQWFNTSTHHNMHHRHVRCNYGTWLNCWDRWMGTNHPSYHETFDAIGARAWMPTAVPPDAQVDRRAA